MCPKKITCNILHKCHNHYNCYSWIGNIIAHHNYIHIYNNNKYVLEDFIIFLFRFIYKLLYKLII